MLARGELRKEPQENLVGGAVRGRMVRRNCIKKSRVFGSVLGQAKMNEISGDWATMPRIEIPTVMKDYKFKKN